MLSKIARRGSAAACAAVLLSAVAAPALADVYWTVNGTFDDGGTLSGWFDINVYGYLEGYDLQTTAGSVEGGYDYTPGDSYFSNGTFYVDAQPGYQQDLHLVFTDPLGVPAANNPIIGGGQSYECVQSFGCFIPVGGVTRYIGTGSATTGGEEQQGGGVPEPAAWTLMITGFGLAGAALRRRRALATAS